MAVKNNPVIGYVACERCADRASVHQVQKGTLRKGEYYTRGCKCKCRQSSNPEFQKYIADNVEFLPGVDRLSHPLESGDPVETRPGVDPVKPSNDAESAQVDPVNQESAETENPGDDAESGQVDQVPGKGGLILIGAVVLGSLAAIVGLRR